MKLIFKVCELYRTLTELLAKEKVPSDKMLRSHHAVAFVRQDPMHNYIVDDDFKITYFDSELAAYSSNLCIGDTCYKAFCQRDKPCFECAAAKQAGGEASWSQYNNVFGRWVRVQRCPMAWDPSGNTLIRTEIVDHEMVDECERTIQVFEGQTVLAGGSDMHVPIMPRNIFLKEAARFVADHDDEAWCMVSVDILNFKLYNE